MRQQSLSSRSWPQHGARDRSAPRQSEEAAATRRHPLAATLSCPRPPNLRRPVRFDSPRSVTSEIRVRASGSAYLDHILTTYRACSVRVASNPTRDGWRWCRAPVCKRMSLPSPNALRDRTRSWTGRWRRSACAYPSKKFWRPLSTARTAGTLDDIGPSPCEMPI